MGEALEVAIPFPGRFQATIAMDVASCQRTANMRRT
jgi:hypothetical protein